jgi:hypothetical protein
MKLFDTFEAVKFSQENMIFITHDGYLYYIYNPKYKYWRKHRNAGNDHLTVANYDDVTKEELVEAMNGVFPKSENDFMRLCNPSQLCIRDMLGLLKEGYAKYMSDSAIYHTIHHFLLESDICHKSYEGIKKLLDAATANLYSNSQVIAQIKELSLKIIGRDIFKREIGIVDGHDSSSYFWIMPVRIIDYEDTADLDSVAEMRSAEISIEEDDVAQYLTPFLYNYFDEELEENKKRKDVSGFEWYLEHNYFTYEQMAHILKDIAETVDALVSGRETEYTKKLKIKRGTATYQLLYAKVLNEEEVAHYNANRPTEDDTEVELVIDFYQRFLYRMKYMMKVGNEKGYNLISFMGP